MARIAVLAGIAVAGAAVAAFVNRDKLPALRDKALGVLDQPKVHEIISKADAFVSDKAPGIRNALSKS